MDLDARRVFDKGKLSILSRPQMRRIIYFYYFEPHFTIFDQIPKMRV